MNGKILILSGTILIIASCNSDAMATPMSLHWSTYLRSGPGEAYPVLAELEHDEALNVGACQGRWCRVSQGPITGYVDRDALYLAQPRVGAARAQGATCFVAGLTSYPGPTPRQFCETSKAASTVPH